MENLIYIMYLGAKVKVCKTNKGIINSSCFNINVF